MAADIGEGAQRTVIAAHDDDALAEIVDRVEIAGVGDLVLVADDLPRRPQHTLDLDRMIFGIGIEPAGQAPVGIRIGGTRRHAELRLRVRRS